MDTEFSLEASSSEQRRVVGLPLNSLGSYQNERLARWIAALKGDDDRLDHRYLAGRWLCRRNLLLEGPLTRPVFVVPAPSRRGPQRDHAMALAEALVELSGWNLKNVLRFQIPEGGAQKTKKAWQRSERRFIAVEDLKAQGGTILFVDDVVTTGSTARAAWLALREPSEFEVWSVAHQPRLAPRPPL